MESDNCSKQEEILDLNQEIYPTTGYEEEDGYKNLIEAKLNLIDDREDIKRDYGVYNKKIDFTFTYKELNELLLYIYSKQKTVYKINFGFGYILHNPITNEFRYHYVSTNNLLFERAITIMRKRDLVKLMNRIISLDLPTTYFLKRHSSSRILAGLTNVEIKIFHLNKK